MRCWTLSLVCEMTVITSVEKENRFCAVIVESSFASFRQIAYVRVGQFFRREHGWAEWPSDPLSN